MRREFGGCAGNIAYNLKLLGDIGLPMATVGSDFAPYREWMERTGVAADHIRVNAIVPGTIDTPMNAVELSDPEMRKHFAEIAPARRLGTPQDLAGIALFLASEDSDYCVGGIFTVDGGLTAV